jgi:hypothetical protein
MAQRVEEQPDPVEVATFGVLSTRFLMIGLPKYESKS